MVRFFEQSILRNKFRFKGFLLPHFFLFIFFIPGGFKAYSQNISLYAGLDTNRILIGDQINLTLEVNQPLNFFIDFPVFYDTIINKIEILEKSDIDTSFLGNEQIRLKQNYLITSFDSGLYYFPPFEFTFQQNIVEDTIRTRPFFLQVFTLQLDSAIFDIKDPYGAPLSFLEILPYLLGGISLILLIFALLYYIRKRKKDEPFIKIRKPVELPHIIAIRELDKLKKEKLWQQNKAKLYYSKLTEIVRIYLEHRFQIRAMEQTSTEIFQSFEHILFYDKESFQILKQLLILADLVKFAKGIPLPDENETHLNNAYLFVNNTKKETTKPNSIEKANNEKEPEMLKLTN